MLKRRNKQPRRTPRDAPWTPFYQCDHYTDGAGNKTALPTGAESPLMTSAAARRRCSIVGGRRTAVSGSVRTMR